MELKKCPFCGSDTVELKYDKNWNLGRFYYVECLACQCRTHSFLRKHKDMPSAHEEDKEEWTNDAAKRACASWNRRA